MTNEDQIADRWQDVFRGLPAPEGVRAVGRRHLFPPVVRVDLAPAGLLGAPPASAIFSIDGAYRYLLTRGFADPSDPLDVGVVMLNPSRAGAVDPDPTLGRVVPFADRLWWGAVKPSRPTRLAVVNLFALVSSDPRQLELAPDPFGPLNVRALQWVCENARELWFAWGASTPGDGLTGASLALLHLLLAARRKRLADPDRPVWCLGTTQSGAPRHPLYMAGDTPFVVWSGFPS